MNRNEGNPPRGRSRGPWVLAGFLAIAAYFLLGEHRAHAIGYLPYVLLAACPLMHLFHRHGGHGTHEARRDTPAGGPKEHGSAAPPHGHEGETR